MTLTATPDVPGRAVLLEAAALAAAAPVAITRTDDNGTRPVRVPRGAVADALGAYTVTDHEAALTGTITYELNGTDVAGPVTLADPTRPAGVFLHAAAYPDTLPALSGAPVTEWRPTRDTGAQLVDVIGRADPIDTGPALARTREHTLTVRFDTLAGARALEQLAADARTIVARHNTPGLDATMTVQTIDGPEPDPGNPRRWLVTLRGRETVTGPYLVDPPA